MPKYKIFATVSPNCIALVSPVTAFQVKQVAISSNFLSLRNKAHQISSLNYLSPYCPKPHFFHKVNSIFYVCLKHTSFRYQILLSVRNFIQNI